MNNKTKDRMIKSMSTASFVLLISILLAPAVLGFGISPAVTNINFEPGREVTIRLDIYNSKDKDMTLILNPSGALRDHIVLQENKVTFTSDEKKKTIEIRVVLPQEFDRPGLVVGEIKVEEIDTDIDADVLNIRPKIAIAHQILVYVPYPGRYAEAVLKTNNVQRGELLPIYITIMNLGQEDLDGVYAQIRISDNSQQEYQTLKTESKHISSKKAGELIVFVNTDDYIPGDYVIDAKVYYDQKEIGLTGSFTIDDFLIQLISIGVNNFNLGQIAKFEMLIRNIGNRIVKDASARLLFTKEDGTIIANTKSFDIDLNPQDVKETVAYWDTRDITVGDYGGTLTLSYEDKSIQRDIQTTIEDEKIEINVIDITGFAIRTPTGPDAQAAGLPSINVQLSIIIILLVTILIVVIVKKKKR